MNELLLYLSNARNLFMRSSFIQRRQRRCRKEETGLVQFVSSKQAPKKMGMKSHIPKTASFPMFLNLQPITVRGSPLRQMKKRIRLTRVRSRKMVERAMSKKLMLPCLTMKNEMIMEETMRKRKTETSTICSFR